jgi:hypothetical protein
LTGYFDTFLLQLALSSTTNGALTLTGVPLPIWPYFEQLRNSPSCLGSIVEMESYPAETRTGITEVLKGGSPIQKSLSSAQLSQAQRLSRGEQNFSENNQSRCFHGKFVEHSSSHARPTVLVVRKLFPMLDQMSMISSQCILGVDGRKMLADKFFFLIASGRKAKSLFEHYI